MKTKKDTIPVIYRTFKAEPHETIALFPTLPATTDPADMMSYMHIGQHGAAYAGAVLERTRIAKPSEYADLAEELKKIGYCLKICKRITGDHGKERQSAIDRIV